MAILYFAPGERGGIPDLPRPRSDEGQFWLDWLKGRGTAREDVEEARRSGPVTAGPQPRGENLPEVLAETAELAIQAQKRRRGPSFCLGAEVSVCGPPGEAHLFGSLGGPKTTDVCYALTNASCLVAGVFVLLALLALATNALIRS